MVPEDVHSQYYRTKISERSYNKVTAAYLYPLRKNFFNIFVNYGDRRFGVSYWYSGFICKAHQEEFKILICSEDL